jgi:hypothetical protein
MACINRHADLSCLDLMSKTVADEDLRAKVTKYVNAVGVQDAAAQLGVSREALSRVAAGFEVRAGTIALVREKMKGR